MIHDDSSQSDSTQPHRPIRPQVIACFKQRLKEAMQGQAPRGFARMAQLSEGAIRSYLSGDTYPTLDRLEQIASASGVSAVWLAFGIGEGQALRKDDDSYTYVSLYDTKCTSESGLWPECAAMLGHLPFKTDALQAQRLNPARLAAIEVAGDSMERHLSDGDNVVFDCGCNELEGDAIYVVRMGDHFHVKRLQRQIKGGVAIISANPAYPVMEVAAEAVDTLEIIGRVVWAGGWR